MALPQCHVFPEGDDLGALVGNVRYALGALLICFRTAPRIEGVEVAELQVYSDYSGMRPARFIDRCPVVPQERPFE